MFLALGKMDPKGSFNGKKGNNKDSMKDYIKSNT